VYEAAAVLVHEHRSLLIYDQADTGVDPQERLASEQSVFSSIGHRLGQDRIQLYVYPPLLADFLVPLTYVSAVTAGRLWIAINLMALFLSALLTISLLKIRWKSLGAVAIVVAFFADFPSISCIDWGQIAIVLCMLWALGIFCYARGWIFASAIVFGLATALKLTPILVIVPFLIWREWRWLATFLGMLLSCLGFVLLVNGPQCMWDFLFHVLPPMTNGVVLWSNRSLLASFEMLNVASMGHTIEPGAYVTHTFVLAGKVACLLTGIAATVLAMRRRSFMTPYRREVTLVLFAMLSVAISPVSWEHGYVVCLLTLSYLWVQAFRTRVSMVFLAALTLGSLEFSWFFVSYIVVHHVRGSAVGLASFITPVFAIVLVLFELAKLNAPVAQSAVGEGVMAET